MWQDGRRGGGPEDNTGLKDCKCLHHCRQIDGYKNLAQSASFATVCPEVISHLRLVATCYLQLAERFGRALRFPNLLSFAIYACDFAVQ